MVRERWDGWHRDSATARGTSGDAGLSPNLREKTVKSGALGEGRRERSRGFEEEEEAAGLGREAPGQWKGAEPPPSPPPQGTVRSGLGRATAQVGRTQQHGRLAG